MISIINQRYVAQTQLPAGQPEPPVLRQAATARLGASSRTTPEQTDRRCTGELSHKLSHASVPSSVVS
ncbi:hypothetical protein BDA96_09G115000 [Sorghum bicolor]|uniref:Uncharacterized protein n=2 Tax=Sorghum bicolor TaxID=4558 RepID=A0A921U3V1_SORBI|nr:hypothetical protein BDA96_09G115000 [Sorghum bicolor]OQU77833.1 hypothetical protein SORBI_3009G109850 [Sorghum bicolor]